MHSIDPAQKKEMIDAQSCNILQADRASVLKDGDSSGRAEFRHAKKTEILQTETERRHRATLMGHRPCTSCAPPELLATVQNISSSQQCINAPYMLHVKVAEQCQSSRPTSTSEV